MMLRHGGVWRQHPGSVMSWSVLSTPPCSHLVLLHRIIESLRLEKTSQINKSNCQPNTTMPTKLCPKVQYLRVF